MIKLIFLISIFLFFVLPSAYAHCPLCTGAVVAGAAGAKYLGLDVTIIGIFVGAFAISLGLWVSRKIKSYFKYQSLVIIILSFILTVVPVMPYVNDLVPVPVLLTGGAGSLLNKVYFVNKLLLGSIIGAVVTFIGYLLHLLIKVRHGKVIVPFQGVVITMLLLLLASVPVYFIMG
ncbi:MAG: hypothetical protein AABW87_02290 [Nanoarchaeota archaeon]